MLFNLSLLYSQTGRRYALVFGNADYSGEAKLENPVNDAEAVSKNLAEIGWNVTSLLDADRRQMLRAVSEFRNSLVNEENVSVLLYYAGHGMQINGLNYLIPVNTVLETPEDVEIDAVSLDYVLNTVSDLNPKTSLVILDACRDNPFAKTKTRSLNNSPRAEYYSGAIK